MQGRNVSLYPAYLLAKNYITKYLVLTTVVSVINLSASFPATFAIATCKTLMGFSLCFCVTNPISGKPLEACTD